MVPARIPVQVQRCRGLRRIKLTQAAFFKGYEQGFTEEALEKHLAQACGAPGSLKPGRGRGTKSGGTGKAQGQGQPAQEGGQSQGGEGDESSESEAEEGPGGSAGAGTAPSGPAKAGRKRLPAAGSAAEGAGTAKRRRTAAGSAPGGSGSGSGKGSAPEGASDKDRPVMLKVGTGIGQRKLAAPLHHTSLTKETMSDPNWHDCSAFVLFAFSAQRPLVLCFTGAPFFSYLQVKDWPQSAHFRERLVRHHQVVSSIASFLPALPTMRQTPAQLPCFHAIQPHSTSATMRPPRKQPAMACPHTCPGLVGPCASAGLLRHAAHAPVEPPHARRAQPGYLHARLEQPHGPGAQGVRGVRPGRQCASGTPSSFAHEPARCGDWGRGHVLHWVVCGAWAGADCLATLAARHTTFFTCACLCHRRWRSTLGRRETA